MFKPADPLQEPATSDEATLLQRISDLISGPLHWFADWPAGDVPRTGAAVYTIWDRSGRLIYVGMSGRSFVEGATAVGKLGPWGRLNSHASGRRSGDQFCIYVCDRLVLAALGDHFQEVLEGIFSLDAETRRYIRVNLGFRWVSVENGKVAFELEKLLQRGKAVCGMPLLNPVRD